MRRLLLGLTGAGLAAVLAVLAVGTVFAEDGDGASTPWDNFIQRLARNLGIEEDRLRDALRQTQLELIDEAEDAGRISAEQADRLRQRVEEGRAPFFGPPGRHGGPGHKDAFMHRVDPIGTVAEETGLSREEVLSELRAGKTLAQIGQEHGVDRDRLADALVNDARESLDQAVQEGKLTQERADRILAGCRDRVDDLLDRTWPHVRQGVGS